MSEIVYSRILRPPTTSFFLGARGVGKSTWSGLEHADALRIDLLDKGLYQRLLAEPKLFEGRLRTVADGVEVWPVRHFCEALAEDRLWP